MNIVKMKKAYKSITSLKWENIPMFTILTGVNGSGKSQLLQLLSEHLNQTGGNILEISEVETVRPHEVFYSNSEFKVKGSGSMDITGYIKKIEAVHTQFKKKPVSSGSSKTFTGSQLNRLYDEIKISSGKEPSELSTTQFAVHMPTELLLFSEGAPWDVTLAFFFYHYFFRKEHGWTPGKNEEIPPWEIFQDFLDRGNLQYDVVPPFTTERLDHYELQLKIRKTGDLINFQELSSGEKVILSMSRFLFFSTDKGYHPKILILDEPDAHLHVDLIHWLIDLLENKFSRDHNIRVIMSTHNAATISLVPEESIFEMHLEEPRIRKPSSKSESIKLLTNNLLSIIAKAKLVFVEGANDVKFYKSIFKTLHTLNLLEPSIGLKFVPVGTVSKGGEQQGGVQGILQWIEKLESTGFSDPFMGLIDGDKDNKEEHGDKPNIFVLNRYSFESYLADPIIFFAALCEHNEQPTIDGISNINSDNLLKILDFDNSSLQKVATHMLSIVEGLLNITDTSLKESVEISFTNGKKLLYPNWLTKLKGKDILAKTRQAFPKVGNLRQEELQAYYEKLNMLPKELNEIFSDLQDN